MIDITPSDDSDILTLKELTEEFSGIQLQDLTGPLIGTEITVDKKHKLTDLVGEMLSGVKGISFTIVVNESKYKVTSERINLQQAYALRDFIFNPENNSKIYFVKEA